MTTLELQWAFGMNSSIPNCVHLLENNHQNESLIFYPVSNNGVIYNINTQQQSFLSLHTNYITSSIISYDKKLLILGDSGASNNQSIISIWNASTYDFINKYELPPNFGVQTLTINKENNLLSAIINESISSKDKNGNNSIIQHLLICSLIKTETNSERIEFKLLRQHKIENQINDGNTQYHFIAMNEDASEIVTHGESIHNFIFWTIYYNEMEIELVPHYTHDTNNIDLSSIGHFKASLFLPFTHGPLITATNSGDLIVWKFEDKKNINKNDKRRIIFKIINKITRGSINCLSLLRNNDIIVLASSTGCVRFYDFEFRVIGWLDYLGDEVISISFALNVAKYGDKEFKVPTMMIGTKHSKIISYCDNGTHAVVVDTLSTVCSAMSSHPTQPIIVIGNKKGEIEIWDILTKKSQLKKITLSQCQEITDIVFSPNGEWLVFGTDTHYLRFYKVGTLAILEFEEEQCFKTSYDGVIENLRFSCDGSWLTLSQSNRISVYRWWFNINDVKREKSKEWILIGNYVSHSCNIVSLHFSLPSALDNVEQRSIPRLFSIGRDNLINEYNLLRSSAGRGLRLKYTFYLKHMSSPTTIQFMEGIALNDAIDSDLTPQYDNVYKEWKYIEDELIVFDDELKLHFYHAPRCIVSSTVDDDNDEEIEALDFRRTVIGASYGAPIKHVLRLKNDRNTFVFCTFDQVIGLTQAPFNGNPYRYFGCIAHPGNINGFELNGEYLITNGGYDECMLIWKINDHVLKQEIIDCDEEHNLNKIYKDLLDDEDNNLYNEIKDYFYYAEIQDKGRISSAPRSISDHCDIKQITSIFQALSCFLTQYDIERIQKEIMHRFHDKKVTFAQFIQIFINYRSSFEMNMDSIKKSFVDLAVIEQKVNPDLQCVSRELFIDVLQRKGDKMSRDELMHCLEQLTGYNRKQLRDIMPHQIDPHFFIQNILGLQQQ